MANAGNAQETYNHGRTHNDSVVPKTSFKILHLISHHLSSFHTENGQT